MAWHGSQVDSPHRTVQHGILLGYLALFVTGWLEAAVWLEPCTLAAISVASCPEPPPRF